MAPPGLWATLLTVQFHLTASNFIRFQIISNLFNLDYTSLGWRLQVLLSVFFSRFTFFSATCGTAALAVNARKNDIVFRRFLDGIFPALAVFCRTRNKPWSGSYLPWLSLQYYQKRRLFSKSLCAGNRYGAGADMAGDAQRQFVHINLISRELRCIQLFLT